MGEKPASAYPGSEREFSSEKAPTLEARSKVLLVEDDDTIANLVTHILGRVGRTVIRARDGAECIRLVGQHGAEIALVILDCRLPDMDGSVLCAELRDLVPELPVLMTSGRSQPQESVRKAGASAFLPKPFRPVDVDRHVTALIGATA